jgi:hypothetical protein
MGGDPKQKQEGEDICYFQFDVLLMTIYGNFRRGNYCDYLFLFRVMTRTEDFF